MKTFKWLVSASLAVVLTAAASYAGAAGGQASGGLTVSAMGNAVTSTPPRQDAPVNYVTAFDSGPAGASLSPGDQFARYQWGLKNDGEFQLVEMKSKFPELDASLGGTYVNGSVPVGPDAYETVRTDAVSGVDINILSAWSLYNGFQTKRQVVVAVIDTGIDIGHQELSNAIWVNQDEVPGDGIDNDGNGYVDDIYGWNFYDNNNAIYTGQSDYHGTHAAGTIAAGKGSFGIAGISDQTYVKIMVLKALGGANGMGNTDSVIAAIQYAEANGASICNLSLGTSLNDERLAQTIRDSRMLFVTAAGNGDPLTAIGYDTDTAPVYPASLPYDNVISVANLLFDGNLSSDSNFGVNSVDIAAPGSYILSTTPGNAYGFMSGTSMAAPMVTGVAAMIYSCRPDMSLLDVKHAILNTARKLDSLNGKVLTGGMLDAAAALQYQG